MNLIVAALPMSPTVMHFVCRSVIGGVGVHSLHHVCKITAACNGVKWCKWCK